MPSRPKKNRHTQPETTLSVQDDVLIGQCVTQKKTPNRGGPITPQYLVFHYTAGRSAQSAVDWLMNPDAKASAHLVVARDGKITQLAPLTIKTWHAGRSHWDGLTGLNQFSIGIEMDNAGPLTLIGNKLKAWFGKEYPKTHAVHATHKWDSEPRWWHTYTEIQITRAMELAGLLVKTYGLKDILGHDDIAPDRKRDPGPAFPLDHIQSMTLGRREEDEDWYEVATDRLNIRKGPGTKYDPVATPLLYGTKVLVLEKRDRWSMVEVPTAHTTDQQDLEGWVSNKYLVSRTA